MAMAEAEIGAPVGAPPAAAGSSYVEWGAVFGGAVLAAALSFVLLTFGTAIGLSATSPWPNSGASARVIASVAVFWVMAQQIGAVMVGAYVAGRMRSRWHETGHEADFRDGLHGGLVWALGVIISAGLVFATAGAAARTGVDVASKAGGVLGAGSDPMDAVLDTMLRPTSTAQAATPAAPAVTGPAAAPPNNAARGRLATAPADDTRAELARLLAASVAAGSAPPEGRAYLTQLVAQRTGLSQQEAELRVDAAVTAAREAADKARRAAILTAFVTAAALILSLGAGWWAAMRGGHHRDTSVPARFSFGERRSRPLS